MSTLYHSISVLYLQVGHLNLCQTSLYLRISVGGQFFHVLQKYITYEDDIFSLSAKKPWQSTSHKKVTAIFLQNSTFSAMESLQLWHHLLKWQPKNVIFLFNHVTYCPAKALNLLPKIVYFKKISIINFK